MAKKPRKRSNEELSASELVSALKFISMAQSKSGQIYQTHCVLNEHWAKAFDGTLTAAHKIVEDLSACPQTFKLLAALSKASNSLSITQLDAGRLSVLSGKFKAIVECVPVSSLPDMTPDAPIASIDDRLKTAFEIADRLPVDNAHELLSSAVILQSGSLLATNGYIAVQYWHGLDLPPSLVIPKAAASAILKSGKPLAAFGFGERSITFYFNDESWIKTIRFVEEVADMPSIEEILDTASNPWPLPVGFFEAVEAVAPFSENDLLYFGGGFVSSHCHNEKGAVHELTGVPNCVFNHKFLTAFKGLIKSIDFAVMDRMGIFYGDNLRGAIMGAIGE